MARDSREIAALVRSMRAMRTSARRRRVPQQRPPNDVELFYFRELLASLEAYQREVNNVLPELRQIFNLREARFDAGEQDRIRALMRRLAARFEGLRASERLRVLARQVAQRVSLHNRLQLGRQVQAGLGVDILNTADTNLSNVIDDFIGENLALLDDLPAKMHADLSKNISRAFTEGKNITELEQVVTQTLGASEARARVIARDQVNKLNGAINKRRQENMGITRFVWRDVSDRRVRPEHQARDGKTYSWEDPPNGETPGSPIQCRCYAEPVFSDILGEL